MCLKPYVTLLCRSHGVTLSWS